MRSSPATRCKPTAAIGDLLRHGEAIQVGQLNIHQDDVRANGPDLGDGLGPVTSLADDRETLRL
jgi:hypothetical protein